MTDVFVSYASPDRDSAFRVVAFLEKQGIACWVAPRDVPPGVEYGQAIIDGIEQSRALVLVLSEQSNNSMFVRKEVERAVSKSKAILPVRIREVAPSGSLEFFISSAQWIDAFRSPMERHLEPLVSAIKALGQAGAAPVRSSTLPPSRKRMPVAAIATGAVVIVIGTAGWFLYKRDAAPAAAPHATAAAATATADAPAIAPAAIAKTSVSANAPAASEPEPGTMVISALGLVNPNDPRFNGDVAAARAEARADAQRQLVEKALALFVERRSLDKNYRVIDDKLLSRSASFIKTVIQESPPEVGKHGLIQSDARAVVKLREVQKSLNQMSKDERIEFIRNNGDPKISIRIQIRNAEHAQALPAERSHLAENVVKERIRSFGFRVWSNQDEAKPASGKAADFSVVGEVKVKQLSAKLAASGLTITKTVLTSWTVKAIDAATGEEIYLNTVIPKGQSWATEDQALADIGKLMGEEFSKNFFLQHFNFGSQKVKLNIRGLPDARSTEILLRELRGIRVVLDARPDGDSGRFELQLPEGSATDIVQDAILKPLNSKLGQTCFALDGASASAVNVSFSAACADAAVRAKLETAPPAGLLNAPELRGKALLRAGAGGNTKI